MHSGVESSSSRRKKHVIVSWRRSARRAAVIARDSLTYWWRELLTTGTDSEADTEKPPTTRFPGYDQMQCYWQLVFFTNRCARTTGLIPIRANGAIQFRNSDLGVTEFYSTRSRKNKSRSPPEKYSSKSEIHFTSEVTPDFSKSNFFLAHVQQA